MQHITYRLITSEQCINKNSKQVVGVIWHKAASPPHTDGSILFARWHQCAKHLVHPIGICTILVLPTAELIWVYRLLDRLSMSFLPLKLPLREWRSGPLSNTCFLGPTQVHISNGISIGLATFAGLTVVTDRLTDQQTDALLCLQHKAASSYCCDVA